MPTYEFRCPNGHTFDRFYRKISDSESETACPECGKMAARQLSAGAGLVFKGSGFYLTDYGKNAHRDSGNTPKRALDTSPGGESAPADRKPAESAPAESSSKDSKAAEPKPSAAPPASTPGPKPEK